MMSLRVVLIYSAFLLSDASCNINKSLASVVNVMDFGALGDGVADDTLPISRALKLAEGMTSPTTVVFPSQNVFLTGPFNVSSCMTLQIDGTVRAKNGMNSIDGTVRDWPQVPPLPSYPDSEDGGWYLQYQAFLYARDASNIHITGRGVVDGGGSWWWTNMQNRSLVQAARPNLLQFVNCTHVEISHVTFVDSPFWFLHPVYCKHLYIHHTTIRSRMYAPNADGMDPDSCRHVLIEYNDVSCGDDHIAIKAGRCGSSKSSNPPINCHDNEAFRNGVYQTDNVTIRYNTFRIGMGIAVGSESSGGIRNVNVHDNIVGLCDSGHCEDICCGWGPALHIKTTPTRGGVIENILFRNNTVYNNTGFILVELDYQSSKPIPKDYPPTLIRNISFVGNRALGGAIGANWHCLANDACEEIVVINNTILNAKTGPWSCQHIRTFTVSGNVPKGLEECMENSMNPPASNTLFGNTS